MQEDVKVSEEEVKGKEYTVSDIVVVGDNNCKHCNGSGYVVAYKPTNNLRTEKIGKEKVSNGQKEIRPCSCLIKTVRNKKIDMENHSIEFLTVDGFNKLTVVKK